MELETKTNRLISYFKEKYADYDSSECSNAFDVKKTIQNNTDNMIFDSRSLDEIISGYKEEKKQPNQLMQVGKTVKKKDVSIDFMNQYKQYRELKNKQESAKLLLNQSALDELEKMKTKKVEG